MKRVNVFELGGMFAMPVKVETATPDYDATMPSPHVVVEALALYAYNVDFYVVFEDIYGRTWEEAGLEYFREKSETWQRNPLTLYGELSCAGKRRMVRAALAGYAVEATRRVGEQLF
jgi:hypothetical protein